MIQETRSNRACWTKFEPYAVGVAICMIAAPGIRAIGDDDCVDELEAESCTGIVDPSGPCPDLIITSGDCHDAFKAEEGWTKKSNPPVVSPCVYQKRVQGTDGGCVNSGPQLTHNCMHTTGTGEPGCGGGGGVESRSDPAR